MMNVPKANLDTILQILPSLQEPTISTLSDPEWVDVLTICNEKQIRELIPRLKAAGACGLIEYQISKIID